MCQADLKQEIIRINNNLNISMFGTGLRKQRVTIVDDDKIIISADHKRIPALSALDQSSRSITRLVDVAILDEYKRRLKAELIQQLRLPVKCVFKDYDPECEQALTVIILSQAACVKLTK
ncbi:MAG: Na-translocating system protein MpsC family protein [Sporomusaceae bacterium]|nr:Na-translocating system protein MpsC family protein [Sporomusaceae bacterium]